MHKECSCEISAGFEVMAKVIMLTCYIFGTIRHIPLSIIFLILWEYWNNAYITLQVANDIPNFVYSFVLILWEKVKYFEKYVGLQGH